MVYIFFHKKTSCGAIKTEITPNKDLAEKLQKPIIRKSGKKSTLTFFRQYLG